MYTRCVVLVLSLTLIVSYHLIQCLGNPLICYSHSRLCLSALHYNENADRMQAVTIDGRPRYSLQFPKAKKGEPTVREIKTKPTYGKLNEGFISQGKKLINVIAWFQSLPLKNKLIWQNKITSQYVDKFYIVCWQTKNEEISSQFVVGC